jgi:MarR family transcriptional regulator, organic hydroperoxide resistance regulator
MHNNFFVICLCMKPEETFDFHIRWAWHKIARLYNNEAALHGLTMSTGFVLLNIDQKEGTPSTKLGPKMGMEPRSLTRTLKTMEDDGLIFRKADKLDKRSVRIFLTEKGKKKRDVSREKVVFLNQQLTKQLGKERTKKVLSLLQEVNEQLDEFEFEN